MKTVTLQIGNSDDKLTQKEWSEFVIKVGALVRCYTTEVHFFACSEGARPWQNACWIFGLHNRDIFVLTERLRSIRAEFKQDSVAWTEGETEFV